MNVLDEQFDVSEALANDPNGSALRAVKDQLETMKSGLKRRKDKGLANDEFTVANNLHKACQAGQDIVEQFWSKPRQ